MRSWLIAAVAALAAGIAEAQGADGSFRALNPDGLRAFIASQGLDDVRPGAAGALVAAKGQAFPVTFSLKDCESEWCSTLRMEGAFKTNGSTETLTVMLAPDAGPGNGIKIDDLIGKADVVVFREVALGGGRTFDALAVELGAFTRGFGSFRLAMADADPAMAWLVEDLRPSASE